MLTTAQVGQSTTSSGSTLPTTFPTHERFIPIEKRINTSKSDDVARYVKEYFTDIPIMAEIARCESTYRHTDPFGDVLRGVVNSKDVGVMQINEYYHADAAKKLGMNLHSFEGNLAYARYLYEKEGVRPWKSSAKCWKGSVST